MQDFTYNLFVIDLLICSLREMIAINLSYLKQPFGFNIRYSLSILLTIIILVCLMYQIVYYFLLLKRIQFIPLFDPSSKKQQLIAAMEARRLPFAKNENAAAQKLSNSASKRQGTRPLKF